MEKYHVLNGDALKAQWPASIQGEQIVCRECFVDGDVQGDDLAELFVCRAKYLSQTYADLSQEEYREKVIPEFKKMTGIGEGSAVYLWFEDDLFCQVNLWCLMYHLRDKAIDLYLVRSNEHNRYGFGGMDQTALIEAYHNCLSIADTTLWAQLWPAYQKDEFEVLRKIAVDLGGDYDFVEAAVEAHIQRIPTSESVGAPQRILQAIISENDGATFGEVFQLFTAQASIYGFGDLMVKRLFDEIIKNDI